MSQIQQRNHPVVTTQPEQHGPGLLVHVGEQDLKYSESIVPAEHAKTSKVENRQAPPVIHRRGSQHGFSESVQQAVVMRFGV